MRATARAALVNGPAYLAYLAYAAYVDFGMPMRLRCKRKPGSYRVLHENVRFPMITNFPFVLFSRKSRRHPMKSVRTGQPPTSANLHLLLPTSINNVGEESPQNNGDAIIDGKRQFLFPIPNGART